MANKPIQPLELPEPLEGFEELRREVYEMIRKAHEAADKFIQEMGEQL